MDKSEIILFNSLHIYFVVKCHSWHQPEAGHCELERYFGILRLPMRNVASLSDMDAV